MLHTFTVSAVNTPAKARIVFNKKLNTFKVIVAFNVHKKIDVNNKVYFAFPTQAKSAYVSGDINTEVLATELTNVLQRASKQLNTSNIELVE
jgi:hypothetical protein